jgi:hypothetical protein
VFHLDTRQHFGEGVSSHFISRAVNKFNVTLFNYIVNEMVSDVDVLGACMVVIILGQSDSGFVVTVE